MANCHVSVDYSGRDKTWAEVNKFFFHIKFYYEFISSVRIPWISESMRNPEFKEHKKYKL